jgi:hypothetical protein
MISLTSSHTIRNYETFIVYKNQRTQQHSQLHMYSMMVNCFGHTQKMNKRSNFILLFCNDLLKEDKIKTGCIKIKALNL